MSSVVTFGERGHRGSAEVFVHHNVSLSHRWDGAGRLLLVIEKTRSACPALGPRLSQTLVGRAVRSGWDVERSDDVDLRRNRFDRSVQGPVCLHDGVACPPHVVFKIVVEHCRDLLVANELPIVAIEIMTDEYLARTTQRLEGIEYRSVTASDGIYRTDSGRVAKCSLGDVRERWCRSRRCRSIR